MHEYALTRQIVHIVQDAVRAHNAKRVLTVHLVVGENTSVIPESVQMYYDQIARGTLAEGARLAVRTVRAEMRCPRCQENFVRPRFSFACPACGTLGNPTDIGSQCYVERVELEE